jgi:hypothetical protein
LPSRSTRRGHLSNINSDFRGIDIDANRPGKDADGSSPPLQWNIDLHITFIAIYAHFSTGEFLRETGPSEDVDYVTTWLTYKFQQLFFNGRVKWVE